MNFFQHRKQHEYYSTYDRQPFFDLVKPYTDDKSIIVEIGPGTDSFAKTIGREDIYLLEGNEESYKKLKQTYRNSCLYQAPDSLPFRVSSVDFIHLSHMIEHLSPSEVYTLLMEIDRVLARGGIIAISTPSLHDNFYNDLSHMKPYNPAVFLKYLVWGDPTGTTRPVVSGQYKQSLLVYRYAFQALPNIRSHFVILDLCASFLNYALGKLRVGVYKKTGYTLILTKM